VFHRVMYLQRDIQLFRPEQDRHLGFEGCSRIEHGPIQPVVGEGPASHDAKDTGSSRSIPVLAEAEEDGPSSRSREGPDDRFPAPPAVRRHLQTDGGVDGAIQGVLRHRDRGCSSEQHHSGGKEGERRYRRKNAGRDRDAVEEGAS